MSARLLDFLGILTKLMCFGQGAKSIQSCPAKIDTFWHIWHDRNWSIYYKPRFTRLTADIIIPALLLRRWNFRLATWIASVPAGENGIYSFALEQRPVNQRERRGLILRSYPGNGAHHRPTARTNCIVPISPFLKCYYLKGKILHSESRLW